MNSITMAETKFEAGKQLANSHSFELEGEPQAVPYMLYVPEDYDESDKSYPLILFLHGLGESGDGGEELDRVTIHGPPGRIKRGDHFPFVVIAPQCPKPLDKYRRAWNEQHLLSLLDHIESTLRIDKQRIYVTGLSMGGFGSWRLAATTPERFAAVAPICGGGKPEYAEALAALPIWAFHGELDDVVPVSKTKDMVKQIEVAGGKPKLTVYPDAKHDSWTETYNNQALYDWFLANAKESSAAKAKE